MKNPREMDSFESFYDEAYKANDLSGFDDTAALDRLVCLKRFLRKKTIKLRPKRILDYGCGQGRYFPIWRELFPDAKLYGAEISREAIKIALIKQVNLIQNIWHIQKNITPVNNAYFDLIISVETMEHVENLLAYLKDIYRLLAPGGIFIWTTPCGNPYSLEWIWGFVTHGIQATEDGFHRFRWESIDHVRRLQSKELSFIMKELGFKKICFDFRTHFFGTIVYQIWIRIPKQKYFIKLLATFAHLDYLLFRKLPNGASMIGIARK